MDKNALSNDFDPMVLQSNDSHLLVYVNSMDQCCDKLVVFSVVSSDQCSNKGHQVLRMAYCCTVRELETSAKMNRCLYKSSLKKYRLLTYCFVPEDE